jgi:hypothetical protein
MSAPVLNWLPNSYYRLLDPRLAARIVAVESGRVKGEIFPLTRLRWVNGQPTVDPQDIEGPGEWDLTGEAQDAATHDLTELIG